MGMVGGGREEAKENRDFGYRPKLTVISRGNSGGCVTLEFVLTPSTGVGLSSPHGQSLVKGGLGGCKPLGAGATPITKNVPGEESGAKGDGSQRQSARRQGKVSQGRGVAHRHS